MSEVPYGFVFCPVCGCPLQRQADRQGNMVGTLQDSLDRHTAIVHPNETTP